MDNKESPRNNREANNSPQLSIHLLEQDIPEAEYDQQHRGPNLSRIETVATKEANNDQHIKITDLEEQIKISNSSASAAGRGAQDGADRSWVAKASFTTELEHQLIQQSLESRGKQSPRATLQGGSTNELDSSSKHEDSAELARENDPDKEW